MNPKLKDLQKRNSRDNDNVLDGTVYSVVDNKQEYHFLKDIPILIKKGDLQTLGEYLIKLGEHTVRLQDNQNKLVEVVKVQNKKIRKLERAVKRYGIDY